MAIPKCIMKTAEAIHKVELSMEEKAASAAHQILNQNFESKVLEAIHKLDLAVVKGIDNFVHSLVHKQHKH